VFNSLLAKPIDDQALASLFKKQLQWMLFLRVVVLTILLGLNLLLQSAEKHLIIPPFKYVVIFIVGVYLFTICSALLLKTIRRYTTFAYSQILIDVLLVSILLYFSGGSQSIFTILYFFPIITGSFILFRRGGLAPAAASTLCYGAILYLEYNGHHPAYFDNFWYIPLEELRSVLNLFSIHGFTFFIAAILSSLLSERLRRTEKALVSTSIKFDQLSVLYKQIFDDIPSGLITVLNSKKIISFNPASEKITGYMSGEIIGQEISEVLPNLELEAESSHRAELEITKKDGSKIPVGYSFAKLNMPGTTDKYQVITLQDLSETKLMEKQVLQAQKMATIGEMTAGIAHEIRNPLAAISGAAQVLEASGDIKSSNQGLMHIITRECNRLQNSIADFLHFSKPSSPEKEWVRLLPMVTEIIQVLEHTHDWPEQCTTVIDIPEKMDCWADAQQIRKLMMNLLHNCCIALKNKAGEIRIIAREITEDTGEEKTILTIIDTGIGISDLIIDKVFEPFFTTRENGTGLGLSIVEQIVKTHDGGITLSSREQEGTTAEVWLPLP
jgi:two-component system sensor histidine kinase PilS (NtrC family)